MLKILHIVPTYLPAYRYGGPIGSVHNLNRGVVAVGAEVTVYTTNIDGHGDLDVPINKPVNIDGVKVIYFRGSHFFRFWFYSRDLRLALRDLQRFDLIHVTSIFLFASTLGAYYARKYQKPYVISPRGSLMSDALKGGRLKKWLYIKIIEKRNLRNASAIHFTTELERENYKMSGLPFKRSIVIPNGIEIESQISNLKSQIDIQNFRNNHGIKKESKVILSLGRLSRIKGFDTLIPAFTEVVKQEPNAVLVIVGGDDGYESNLKSQISNLKSEAREKIILTGDLRGDDKTAAYMSADVFVMPSYSENFGMAALEAMRIGLPVIVTEGVGIASEIKEAKAGIVVPKNTEKLAKAIVAVLKDETLSRELGERGKNLVESQFSEDRVAHKFLEAYQDIIAAEIKR